MKLIVLFVCRGLGLFRIARQLTHNCLKILCYHGFEIDDETSFRPQLFIKPDRFEQRLAAIRREGFHVLPLNEALERLYTGTLAKDSLVITVDDGFHSFHRIALPYLQRYGYPATVYVTTYYVQHGNPIFRLAVQYIFWKARVHELTLEDLPWGKNRIVDLTDPAQANRAMWDCIDYGEHHCSEAGRYSMCQWLGAMLGVPYDLIVKKRILHLMSPEELCSLAAQKVAVALHTHRHTFSWDDEAAAEREIADNRAALCRWMDEEKRHFCYPSGLWNERQWGWLDKMNIKSSTTCLPGLNDRNTPRHALRRFLDGDNIHRLEFEAALSGFSDLFYNMCTTAHKRYCQIFI